MPLSSSIRKAPDAGKETVESTVITVWSVFKSIVEIVFDVTLNLPSIVPEVSESRLYPEDKLTM